MADPFGIVGVISLTIQITQVAVQFGLDWKDAPQDVKTFMAELQILKTVLSETNTNILLNPDFAEAFQNRPSLLLSQLGPSAPSTTDTKLVLAACQKELENVLSMLKKRAKGHRVGWERFKGAFLAKDTRESVDDLHRQCQTLNSMMTIDSTVLGVTTYKEVKEARKEQQETRKEQQDWHSAGTKVSLSIKDGVDQLSQGQENQQRQQERRVFLDWLTSIDYSPQQSDFISRRQQGTGQWLLDLSEFKEWLNQNNQTLFCTGIPGAGKTIIASIVVDHLCARFQNDASIGIAYIYCNFRRHHEQKPLDLLASLLRQLIHGLASVPQGMRSLYERHQNKQTCPSFDEISIALQSIVANYSKAFIVIDALDECQVSDGGRKRFLTECFNIQDRTGASILATSRSIPDIVKEFEGRSTQLEIRATDDDLQRYLDGHMLRLPSFVSRSADLQREVKNSIINAVDGMFLLAQLHLDSLIGKRSPKAIRIALEKLPKGSQAYDHAYKEAMERIEGQVADSQELAKQVLSWITCAKRPLITLELRHALAVEIGESEIDKENLPEIEDVVSVCAGLVTVDEKSDVIRLVHYTTQEYFERKQKFWFCDAQKDITTTCVTYLLFNAFDSGFCSTDQEFETRLQQNPLYDYAAVNWGHHACAAPAEVEQSSLNLLKNEAKVSASSQAMMASGSYSGYSQRARGQMTGVHVAAYFGLREAITVLLRNGHDPNFKDAHGRTPLSYAAQKGNEAVVKLLLAKDGVDLDSDDSYGQTPLSWAAENGHEVVVKLLLAKDGVDPDSKNADGRTPLLWAAENSHEAVVKLLLAEEGVGPDSKDENGQTALSLAAWNGHETVMKLLLMKDGVHPDCKDENGRTPLSLAAWNGHEALVKLLLAKDGVHPDSKDENSRTPLLLAAWNGHEAVVRLLLAKDGVDQNSKDNDSGTPLSWAAGNGHEEVVELLLANDGVDPDIKDNKYGRTPLSWATLNGHEAVVKLLLAADGVNPNSKDYDGQTPLSQAAWYGHEPVVRLLLAMDGVVPDSKNNNGWTPLSCATRNRDDVVVKLLLAKNGVDPDSKDKNGQTPLSLAAAHGHETVVEQLLTRDDLDLDSKDNDGRTPLSYAVGNGQKAVVKLLLAKDGVDPDSKDFNGRTPLSWAAVTEQEWWMENSELENVVELLLTNNCVDVNTKDTYGRTPLSRAAGEGHSERVKLLLGKNGIDPHSKDDLGQTPLWWATKNGHEDVVKMLTTSPEMLRESSFHTCLDRL